MIKIKEQIDVVAAIIKNENDEILCALRGPQMSLANYWEFPGGKVESHETKEEALIREIKEELNCEIEVLNEVEDTIYEYDNVIVRLHTFMAKIKSGHPQSREHEQIRWQAIDKLRQLKWAPADIEAVEKVIRDERRNL